MWKLFAAFVCIACATQATGAALAADAPHICDRCEAWNAPRAPFKVYGDTWFVGTQGLSSILITSKGGHVLIDGGLPQSAPVIAANIEKLGFRLKDVKLILNSHTHYDHAGGIAALQRASGAQVAASPAAKRALERGGPTEDDPQFAFGVEHNAFPVVAAVRGLKDGEILRVGALRITAHFTPGHTPGGTTWSWTACERDQCFAVVYADSLNAVSAPDFLFSKAPPPNDLARFERSIATVAALECGILLVPHPEQIDLDAKLAARTQDSRVDPLRDAKACAEYAAAARARLGKRVADEGGASDQ